MSPPSNTKVVAMKPEPLVEELGRLIIESQNEALKTQSHFDIGISGGSQGPMLAKALLNNKDVKFDKWRVWLVDERIVPLTHEDSNYRLFYDEVYSKLPESQRPEVFPLSSKLLEGDYEKVSSQEFAKDYQNRLIETLGPNPSLDFVLLGMGPDGHTCSLFPGHKLLNENELFVSSLDDSPKPPPRRITFTKRILKLANRMVFLATGASKKDVVHAIFVNGDDQYPSKQVMDISKNEVIFLTDRAALGDTN